MSDRPTSLAKSVQLESDADAILQKYGYATKVFDHARDPTISQQLTDVEAERARTPQTADQILEKYGSLKAAYNTARDADPSKQEKDQTAEVRVSGVMPHQGSDMVAQSAPRLEPRPPAEIAAAQDRETHNERVAADAQRARAANALIQKYRLGPSDTARSPSYKAGERQR